MSVFLKSSTLKRRGLAGVLGERISEAVAKVEDGRMAVLPKIGVGLARQVRMVDFCAPVIKSGRGGAQRRWPVMPKIFTRRARLVPHLSVRTKLMTAQSTGVTL
jgi:hypothetical protein